MADLKILSLNVRGLVVYLKRKKLFTYLHAKEHNVILLQETHSNKQIERRWRTEWGGPVYYSHGTSPARGVAILIKRKTNIKVQAVRRDKEGRYMSHLILSMIWIE